MRISNKKFSNSINYKRILSKKFLWLIFPLLKEKILKINHKHPL